MNNYIGIDLGGTNLKYAIGNEAGELSIKKIKPSLALKSKKIILENIFDAILELKNEFNGSISGIGLGTPGCINFIKGQLKGAPSNIPALIDAPLKMILEDEFKLPVWVDNDANLMTLAETRVGAAKKYSDVVCLTIGTGIGGGLIINNKLYRGFNFTAAEIGHMVIEKNGKSCSCGNNGCLEIYASAPAIVERYKNKAVKNIKRQDVSNISTEYIFKQAKINDIYAIQTIEEISDYLGMGIANIVNLLSPQVVVIGGGVANAGDYFIKKIEKATKEKALSANSEYIKVVNAKLGNDAGMIGAIFLAAEHIT